MNGEGAPVMDWPLVRLRSARALIISLKRAYHRLASSRLSKPIVKDVYPYAAHDDGQSIVNSYCQRHKEHAVGMMSTPACKDKLFSVNATALRDTQF